MVSFLLWLVFGGRRCPWGCGAWVSDENVVQHWTVEHAGDPRVAPAPGKV